MGDPVGAKAPAGVFLWLLGSWGSEVGSLEYGVGSLFSTRRVEKNPADQT